MIKPEALADIAGKIQDVASTYQHKAPEGSSMPYLVIMPIDSGVLQAFGKSRIEDALLQIAYYEKYDGDTDSALNAMRDVENRLDMQFLDSGGCLWQSGDIRFSLLDGRIVRLITEWKYQDSRTISTTTSL